MRTITTKEIVEACAKAYDEGRLGAQNGHYFCMYSYDDGSVCAIGAVFTDKEITMLKDRFLNTRTSVFDLVDEKIFRFSGKVTAARLQEFHDNWAHTVRTPREAVFKEEFVAYLETLKKRYLKTQKTQ